MATATPQRASRQPKPSTLAQRVRKLLDDHPNGALLAGWFKKAGNVTLACWDEGHEWDQYGEQSTHTKRDSGIWDTKQPCLRQVDGESCKVRRVRHIDLYTGRIAMANGYDYSGAPTHTLPRNPATNYTILDKNVRAIIRLERRRRAALGEETTDDRHSS